MENYLVAVWGGFCAGVAFSFALLVVLLKMLTNELEPVYYWFPSKRAAVGKE